MRGDHISEPSLRRLKVTQLLKERDDLEDKTSLEFGLSVLGNFPAGQQGRYILEKDHLALLKQWLPQDPHMVLEMLEEEWVADVAFDWDKFEKAANIVLGSDGAVDKLSNPVLRAILKDYIKMAKVDLVCDYLQRVSIAILKESTSLRLGVAHTPTNAALDMSAVPDEVLLSVHKACFASKRAPVQAASTLKLLMEGCQRVVDDAARKKMPRSSSKKKRRKQMPNNKRRRHERLRRKERRRLRRLPRRRRVESLWSLRKRKKG